MKTVSSMVRAKPVGKDFLAGLKNTVGGELKANTDLVQQARAGILAYGSAVTIEPV